MSDTGRQSISKSEVLAIIMGGGQGTRLFPLTKERAKPAVPLAGKYRLVDVPISNCINSDLRRIYLLTQFNSASLHRHISQSYKFDHFTGGFVEILAAEQTYADTSWYQGTADAVRKNLIHVRNHDWKTLVILSGDQLYRMDLREVIDHHKKTGADVTVATIPVRRDQAPSLGIMQIDEHTRITRFVEKPSEASVQDSLRLDPSWHTALKVKGGGEFFLASMGIYAFSRDVIFPENGGGILDNDLADFGKHIIPQLINTRQVYSYIFQGYWEDIGTIRAFFEANLDLTRELPRFNFFDMHAPIFSRPRYLPGSKVNGAVIDHAIISDGCIINRASIQDSIVGLRCVVGEGTRLTRTILLGSDYYETQESIENHERLGLPRVGIGSNCRIENTIVDKNARIGNNVIISPRDKPDKVDDHNKNYYIRDGIVVIPKNAVIPHNTII